jgi:hypothetical protein
VDSKLVAMPGRPVARRGAQRSSRHIEENRVLREQRGDRRLRFTNTQRRRLAMRVEPSADAPMEQLAGLVTPDTILRWYRERIAKQYDGTAQRRGGSPGTATSLQRLVVQFATENPSWVTRGSVALRNLGYELGRNTIKRILVEHGLDPAPECDKTMPWKTFLKAHFGVIAATDFFAVEVLTPSAKSIWSSGEWIHSGVSSVASARTASTSPALYRFHSSRIASERIVKPGCAITLCRSGL